MNPTPQLVESLPASAAMLSRTRFRVLALISAGTMINYLDRTVLGVAAPHMATDLHISPAVMGIVFSAFSWSYAAAQIPGGWVLDRIGTRLTYFLAVTLWSLFTLLQGFASGVATDRVRLGWASKRPFRPTSWLPHGSRTSVLKYRGIYGRRYLGLACFGRFSLVSAASAGGCFS
jgi:ACS family D-galactonate transporter-like MFS transporter